MNGEKTREELIEIIASDHGHGPEKTNQFSTETLRKAYNSDIGAFRYINNLIFFSDAENEASKGRF
ncbi:MAG: hypothetical protein HRT71_19660 [Flavobacteriales bacterium]|nr:hypothetical protein [Flavobacteriales bacterium]